MKFERITSTVLWFYRYVAVVFLFGGGTGKREIESAKCEREADEKGASTYLLFEA